MRRHVYMLLGAFVLASAFGEAHLFVINSNEAGNETKPETMVDDQHQIQTPNVGEVDKFDRGVEGDTQEIDHAETNGDGPISAKNVGETRAVSRDFVFQDSDESSDSLEDGISDEMLPPMPVRLALVKQFVQANKATGNSPVRSSLVKQDHAVMTEWSTSEQHVVERSEITEPSGTDVRVIGDSDEDDHSNEQDTSLEVDVNLLPEIRRFLKLNLGNREATGHRELVFRDNEDLDSSLLEAKDIVVNPIFQQKMREIDNRLKRAPRARAKRLMQKYAEALGVYSLPSLNMSSTSVTFSSFLPFFITCLLISLS